MSQFKMVSDLRTLADRVSAIRDHTPRPNPAYEELTKTAMLLHGLARRIDSVLTLFDVSTLERS